jgi:uncharacterized protein (TIGR02145 family)
MKNKIWFYKLIVIWFVFFLLYSCEKDMVKIKPKRIIEYGTVVDIDSNSYKTVKIGDQWWMAENLKVTKYQNGDPIPNILSELDWPHDFYGAYCNYDNNPTNGMKYGRLYNWYAVRESRKLAPLGWHIPTKEEWTILTDYLDSIASHSRINGEEYCGVSEALGWSANDVEGSTDKNNACYNNTGFTAIKYGFRYNLGSFSDYDSYSSWWSSTYLGDNFAWSQKIYPGGHIDDPFQIMGVGYSVRCVKDLTTSKNVPTVITIAAIGITTAAAISGGNVISDGGAIVNSRGVCWSTKQNPTISNHQITNGNGVGSFTIPIYGLSRNTLYYLWAYATNSVGTGYGNAIIFKTLKDGIGVDIDGNVYNTVTIGTQVWMVENLKTTRYNNGDPIPNVSDNSAWAALTTGAYCNYNNDTTNATIYGRLYNWYAINNRLAPDGWHIANDVEWNILTTYLGGVNIAGGKLKEIGTNHWKAPNTEATNESGFTALPGGYRSNDGIFRGIESGGYKWSSTEDKSAPSYALDRSLSYSDAGVFKSNTNKRYGFSVRCVRD